jgi:hypothetical protein
LFGLFRKKKKRLASSLNKRAGPALFWLEFSWISSICLLFSREFVLFLLRASSSSPIMLLSTNTIDLVRRPSP